MTKRDERGVPVSSVPAPWLQAMMIGQAGIGAGMRVMEIGSGGCGAAALLREIAGDGGQATTVDIDSEVADRASRCLAAAGYDDIEVICRARARDARTHSGRRRPEIPTRHAYEQVSGRGNCCLLLRYDG